MNNRKRLSILLVISSLVGLLIIFNFQTNFLNAADNLYEQIKRFMEVFNIVKQYYVEDVESENLVTNAIEGMLEGLDPHSVYIEAEKLKQIDERFKGHYYGIGIEFIIKNKILTVVSPIVGSPSDALGIRPHDQIIKIEGESAYGITEQEVFDKLRGPKGSKVTVTIRRPGLEEPFDVTITRDKIPIYSVMATFMIDNETGYIYLGRFAKTTVNELEQSLVELESQGMKKLILDLRGNSGGYLDQAVLISDKFIDGRKKIVYTKGRRAETNDVYYSSAENTHPRFPLIILIDNGSASASEIVAGAVQDWDRGLIVGETSFGKGLVQNQIPLKDGSALRLTTARYYTPSGRLIQRPYENGIMDYYEQGYDDVDPNAEEDSTANKPIYYTDSGRKVYGGGGITPDVTIKSKKITKFTSNLISNRVFFDFASQYANKRPELSSSFNEFYKKFHIDNNILSQFRKYITEKEIEMKEEDFVKDLEFIKLLIKSELARNIWDSKAYYQIRMSGDYQVRNAMEHFQEAANIASIALN
ncbi:PDZ domain-containing protein [candidate division KSB1 bacterium]|nr:PDZ domain-containing protein [candidate division KSB1 bacterium]